MSEEEIIKIIKYMLENRNTDINVIINYEAIQGLLNLYTKQQEKIEDYKKFKKDIVSKIMFWDKEELPDNERIMSMLDTLMEEVSRLEDIEDKKVEVAIDFIEAKRDKFWQDKIRETIEHYNNELEHIKNGEEFENEKPMYYWGKAALEGLLEEN